MPTPLTPVQEQIFAYFPVATHPARFLEAAIEAALAPESAVLDIGCGRTAPNLVRLIGKAGVLHGIDLVPFAICNEAMQLHNCSVTDMPAIADSSIDLAYSRAVMEHLDDPTAALAEIHRVLKPGGRYIFITPSIYDYGSIVAAMVPNAWHPRIVRWLTGRKEEDVFPTRYRANSERQIRRLAENTGLNVREFDYLGQYPAYLTFNRLLFWFGSMYELMLARFKPLHPLRGWIYCVLEKPVQDSRIR